jgi:hypothetical protein
MASNTTDAARLTRGRRRGFRAIRNRCFLVPTSIPWDICEVEYLRVTTVGAPKDLHVPMLLTHLGELTEDEF